MRKLMTWWVLLALFAGCSQSSVPASTGATPVIVATSSGVIPSARPPSGPAKELARAAFQDFGGKLKSELQAAIAAGGPVQAVEVCHTRAPLIAQEVSTRRGIEMGRSSHRTRNRANDPTPALAAYLKKHAQKKADQVPVEVIDEGEHQLVIAPIPTAPLCLTCHGNPETFSVELQETLAKYYPEDRATGFEEGDMRGVFWAKIKP